MLWCPLPSCHGCRCSLAIHRPRPNCRTLCTPRLQVILATPLGLTRLMDVLNEQEVRSFAFSC